MKASQSQPKLGLTGGYLPKDQRVRVAREIRRTHFNLGDANYGYLSMQKTDFQHPIASLPASNLGYIDSIRKSHISMSPDPPRPNQQSEFRASFPVHDVSKAVVTISQEVRADLRRHHFDLGKSPSPFVTTMQGAYCPQDRSAASEGRENIQLRVRNLRKHNFQLGSESVPLISITQKDFVPKSPDGWENEERLKQFKGDLRTSHFRVGDTSQTYVSTARKDYSPKPNSMQASIQMHLLKDNFALGSDSHPLASTSHLDFKPNAEGRQTLNEEKLNDLRSSHFQLGGETLSYVPTSLSSFAPHPAVSVRQVHDIGLRNSHFTLGQDGDSWTTMYQRTHQGKTDALALAQRDRNADKASHLIVGSDPAPIVSVTQSTYLPHTNIEPGKLDAATSKDLRSHHFAMGSGRRDFVTTSNDFTGEIGPPGMMDPELRSDLRTHHFTYGHEKNVFVSRNQVDYQSRPGKQAKLAPGQMKDLRSSHFVIGENEGTKGTTEYKGKYQWVQPVADRDYHFTFE